MNPVNPAKLLNSKWTAVRPANKEKHFIVTDIEYSETVSVVHCVLEAVHSNNEYAIDWRALKDAETWRQGWK